MFLSERCRGYGVQALCNDIMGSSFDLLWGHCLAPFMMCHIMCACTVCVVCVCTVCSVLTSSLPPPSLPLPLLVKVFLADLCEVEDFHEQLQVIWSCESDYLFLFSLPLLSPSSPVRRVHCSVSQGHSYQHSSQWDSTHTHLAAQIWERYCKRSMYFGECGRGQPILTLIKLQYLVSQKLAPMSMCVINGSVAVKVGWWACA